MSINRPIKTEERTEECEKKLLSTPRKCLALSNVKISGVLGAILGIYGLIKGGCCLVSDLCGKNKRGMISHESDLFWRAVAEFLKTFKESGFFPSGLLNTQSRADVDL